MEIRKTRPEELEEVMEIYAHARRFMAEHGNPNQWKNTNPPVERVKQDIAEGKSHVCVADNEILGVFYFAVEDDPTYVKYTGEHGKNPGGMVLYTASLPQERRKAWAAFA